VGSRKWNRGSEWRENPEQVDQQRRLARLGSNYLLPLLRVTALPCRRLGIAPTRPFGPRDTSEAWWQAVLADWRVRPRQGRYHFDRLGEHAGATIVIECRECTVRREFQTKDLVSLYGAEYRMVYLRYELADCPMGRIFKDCAVRYLRD
jgi:hypothetical protein